MSKLNLIIPKFNFNIVDGKLEDPDVGAKLEDFLRDLARQSETDDILDKALITKKINDLAVTTEKIADLAVTSAKRTGIDVKVGSFTCPAETGNYSVTGVGFEPRYIKFEWGYTSDSQLLAGNGGMDYNGNQHSISWAGRDDFQRSLHSETCCIWCKGYDGVNHMLAYFVSTDSDGFTINIPNYVNTGIEIHWVAFR